MVGLSHVAGTGRQTVLTLLMENRSLTFIVNPVSGHPWSQRRRAVHRLLAELQTEGIEVLITQAPGDATDWARARADAAQQVVIAVGGDGTVHEVAEGLLGGQASLGILPVGSGNDFASMLGHPFPISRLQKKEVLTFFESAEVEMVDSAQVTLMEHDGEVITAPFINSLGLGLEGAVAATVTRLRSIKGLSRYLVATLWQLAHYQPLKMKFFSACGAVSELTPKPVLLIAVGNGRRAGGGFLLQPKASITDGRLDLCWAGAMPWWRQLSILPSVLSGEHGRYQEIHQAQIESLEIHCEQGTPVHLDGECVARRAKKILVQIQPRSLRVIGA